MRAARLHGPGDLRVEEVDEPAGEVVVEVEAATACATDVKMLRFGHKVLGPYPACFGHETAGIRLDTGERVLVSDSVACGACAACVAGRSQVCRSPTWVLGGFAERIGAPLAALHTIPDGLPAAAAAMAEPLAAAVHAVARAGPGEDCAVLGGGPMGQMLARLLVLEGRSVTLADSHAERRAQACGLGARALERFERAHGLVFEAVGRPEAWRAAVEAAAPGGVVVLVGGCPAGSEAMLPAAPMHYDELELRGAFHHSPAEVNRALALLAEGAVPWRAFAGVTVGLEGLPLALEAMARGGGEARKLVVDPRLAP